MQKFKTFSIDDAIKEILLKIDYIEHRVLFSGNFAKSYFSEVTKFERKVFNGTESNGVNLLSQIRGIVENSLGHLFITSSSSHFFNKTDLELYIPEVVLLKSVLLKK